MSQNSKVKEEKQEKANLEAGKRIAQLTQCIAISSSSPEGIIAYRQVMNMCGYNKSAVTANPQTGDINLNGTLYNTARENLWKELRQLIPIKTLKKIEFEKTVFTEVDND